MVLTKCKFCHTLPQEVSKRNKWVIQSIFINNPPPPHPPLSVSVSLSLSVSLTLWNSLKHSNWIPHALKDNRAMMMMAINCFCKMVESVEPEFRLFWMKLCSSYNQQAQKKNKKQKKTKTKQNNSNNEVQKMKKEDDKNELYISCHSRTTTYGTKKSHIITFTSCITKTIYKYIQYILQT